MTLPAFFVAAAFLAVVFCLLGFRLGAGAAIHLAEKARRCDALEVERGYLMDLIGSAERRAQQLTERAEAAEIDAARWQRESEQVVRIVWVPLMQEPGVEQ